MTKLAMTFLLMLVTSAHGLDLGALKAQLPEPDKDGKLTGPTREAMALISDAIFAAGRDGIDLALADLNVLSESDRDYRSRYIVHDLVVRAADNAGRRAVLVIAMSDYIQRDAPPNAREYVIQQLQLLDSAKSANALGSLLSNPELGPAAGQALTAIGGDAARDALLAALPTVKGAEARTVILALGKTRDAKAVPVLLPYAESADPATRIAAIESLGMIGDPAATDVLLKAAAEEEGFARSLAGNACLALAESLTKAGKPDEALVLLRALLGAKTGGAHIRGAALYNLAAAIGAKAAPDVLSALAETDNQLRQMAIQAGTAMPADTWLAQTRSSNPLVRAGVIRILGAQGGMAGIQPALAALADNETSVRLAAISANGALGSAASVPLLLQLLDDDDPEAGAAKSVLLHIRGDGIDAALAEQVGSGETTQRLHAIEIVTTRKTTAAQSALIAALGEDQLARAALKALREMGNADALAAVLSVSNGDPEAAAIGICERERGRAFETVSAALNDSSGETRSALLRVMGHVGGGDALAVLVEALTSAEKDAAVRGLSKFPDSVAIAALLEVASGDYDQAQHVLAIRGALRLIAADRAKDPEKVANIATILTAARRPEERKSALSSLANIRHADALATAELYLSDPELKNEAGLAIVKVAERIVTKDADSCRQALEKLIAGSDKGKLQDKARNLLKRIPPE
jgi:HEAT repeat protein